MSPIMGHHAKTGFPRRRLHILLFILAFSSLFLGFYRNQWQMVRPKKFSLFQKDVESYVVARMVMTRQSGLLSNGGLLGWGDVDPADVTEADYQNQYDVYLKGLSYQTYWPKQSHPGFQGLFFSMLDRLSPFSPSDNLRLYRGLASALFAVVLTGLLAWFYTETGAFSAIFVFVSMISSQWMTLFGRNLFFVSGLFYLPMLALLLRFQSETAGKPFSQKSLFWLTFSLLLLKCLFNGYDFILPTLGMTATPIVFYGVMGRWSKELFFKRFMIVVLASMSAILASLSVLTLQIMSASGSFQAGVEFILQTVSRRTLGTSDPYMSSIYEQASNASTWSILKIYLSESYFYKFDVPYGALLILFAAISVVYWIAVVKRKPQESFQFSKGLGLLAATWFSLLGTLGWYIIFKSVAYFHTHMNYLPWHMPFTLFGFGLCGFLIETFLRPRSKSSENADPNRGTYAPT